MTPPTRELVKKDNTLSQRDIETLISVGAIPKTAPPEVIEFFSRACAETRLSPFKRQIHLIKRHTKDGDRYTLQTGIDGYRTISDRTGKYAGNDEYLFDEGLTIYQMLEAKREKPRTAKATVWKIVGGVRCPFTAEVRWVEYVPPDNMAFMWNKMPFNQLGKCAEAAAHRKAFPEETSGIYTEDEITILDEPLIRRANVPKLKDKDLPVPVLAEPDGEGTQSHTKSEARESNEAVNNAGKTENTDSRGGQDSKKKPSAKLQRKTKVSPSRPNREAMIELLTQFGASGDEFLAIAKSPECEWLPQDATWNDLTEEQFAQFLDKDNRIVVIEALGK